MARGRWQEQESVLKVTILPPYSGVTFSTASSNKLDATPAVTGWEGKESRNL
jgi:hypothetical protein